MASVVEKRKPRVQFALFLLMTGCLFLLIAYPIHLCFALDSKKETLSEQMQFAYAMESIDTFVVSYRKGPFADVAQERFVDTNPFLPAIISASKEFLTDFEKGKKNITVSSGLDFNPLDLTKTNVLNLIFTLSAIEETINGQRVTLISLGMKPVHHQADGTRYEVPTEVTATYPMILSKDAIQVQAKLREGTALLLRSAFCGFSKDEGACKSVKDGYDAAGHKYIAIEKK